MNIFKISLQMIKNNRTLYQYYLVVLILTTAILYNFLAVRYNPYLAVLNTQYIYAEAASVVCSIILLFGLVLFLFHSGSFFYKLRYKEIGTYMLMGVSEHRIGLIFVIETMILGGTSNLVGLPVGMLFSKLFFMMLGKAMILRIQIPFYLSPKAVIWLILIMGILQLVVCLKSYRKIQKSRLIDILNAARMEQKVPRIRMLRGIAGVIMIGVAYYLAMHMLDQPFGINMNILNTSLVIIIFVCVGTYFFFGSFLALVLDLMIKNKPFIYRGTRLISYSNIRFRLGSNYRSLSMTAILCAGTFAALSGSLALYSYADQNIHMEAPYSITYMGQDEVIREAIRTEILDSSHEIVNEHETLVVRNQITSQTAGEIRTSPCLVTSISELQDSLRFTMSEQEQKKWQSLKVQNDEVIKIIHSNLVISGSGSTGKSVSIGAQDYSIINEVKLPFVGELEGFMSCDIYVVSDQNYEQIKVQSAEISVYGINITEPEKSTLLIRKIAGLMKNPADNLNSYVSQYEVKYYLVGSFYFMGLVMSMVFAIAMFGTMYYKILSDVIQDREQYQNLIKLGMTEAETGVSIRTQVRIAFVLPAMLGVLHGVMAIKAMEEFMHYSYLNSILTGVFLFAIMLFCFYRMILKKYRDMVLGGLTYEAIS